MTSDEFDAGPMADVRLAREGTGWTLVFVRDLHHPLEKVYAALTDPKAQEEWSPVVADRDLGSRGPVLLRTSGVEGAEPEPAEVVSALPPRLLEYTWGTDRLRWELEAVGGGTRLTLRHSIQDRGTAPMAAAGWHLCFAVLARLLERHPIGPIVGPDAMRFGWDELHLAYQRRLGLTVTR